VTFTNWVPGHTDNFVSHTQEDCVAMIPYKGGIWDDIPCGGQDPFLGVDVGESHLPFCEYSRILLNIKFTFMLNQATCKTIHMHFL